MICLPAGEGGKIARRLPASFMCVILEGKAACGKRRNQSEICGKRGTDGAD